MNTRSFAIIIIPLALLGCRSTTAQSQASTAESSRTAAGAPRAGEDPLMRPGPAIKGHASDQVVSGRVAEISAGSVAIESERGERKTLEIVPQTTILLDGRDATYAEVTEGQPVRASFNQAEGRDVAVELQFGRPADAREERSAASGYGADSPMHGSASSSDMHGSAGAPDAHSPMHGSASTDAQRGTAAGEDPLMKPGPAIKGHASDQVVSGRIAALSPDSVEIERDVGSTVVLDVVPQTTVLLDGADASFSELKEGQRVRASFNDTDGRDVAVEIQAGAPAPEPAGPAGGTQGGSTGSSGSTGDTLQQGSGGAAGPER